LHPNPSELTFDLGPDQSEGSNLFEFSSHFFNMNAGLWEPIVEKWAVNFWFEFHHARHDTLKVDLLTPEIPLNINISDEMVFF
jgi:hypothetical protein